MTKITERLNPNTKQFWEKIYSEHIDQKKIRSGRLSTAYFYVIKA